MWELIQLDISNFSFKLLGNYDTLEDGINARTQSDYQFVLYCGPLSSDPNERKNLIAKIDSMHHNDIRLVLKSNYKISNHFVCIHEGYNGPDGRINCYYWSDKNSGYGWVVDGGKC